MNTKMALRIFFNPNMTHCNIFDSRWCFSKIVKTQKLSHLWSNLIQNVVSLLRFFSIADTFFSIFYSIFDTFYVLIWKSDASWNCLFKNNLSKVIQKRSNRSFLLTNVIQNVIFRKQTFFQIPTQNFDA